MNCETDVVVRKNGFLDCDCVFLVCLLLVVLDIFYHIPSYYEAFNLN